MFLERKVFALSRCYMQIPGLVSGAAADLEPPHNRLWAGYAAPRRSNSTPPMAFSPSAMPFAALARAP